MQGSKRGTSQQSQYETNQTPGKQPAVPHERQVTPTEHLPDLDRHDDGKQVGQIAQGEQQNIGNPGAHAAPGITHLARFTAAGPAGIGGVVAQQRHAQVQAQGDHRQQCALAETQCQLFTPYGRGFAGFGILQNAGFHRYTAAHCTMSGSGIHNCLDVRRSVFGDEYKLRASQVTGTGSHNETIFMNHNNLYRYLDKLFKHSTASRGVE